MYKWHKSTVQIKPSGPSSIFFASGAHDDLDVRIIAQGFDGRAKQQLHKFLARGVTEAVLVSLPQH